MSDIVGIEWLEQLLSIGYHIDLDRKERITDR